MATNNSAVGVVTATKGEVFARGEDGKMRRLNVGDQILEHDVIVTANGSAADISMFNAPPLSVAEQQTISVDAQVTAVAPDATAASVAPLGSTEAAKVIQTVATGSGLDVNALLDDDAAAAGLTGGDGADGGHTFVDLMRIVENVPGAGYDFPAYGPGTAPTLEGQILVSNGLPTAGDITIAVDEDDLACRKWSESDLSWREEFSAALGWPDFPHVRGNSDVQDGDDLPDPSPTVMTGNLNFSYGPDGMGGLVFNMPTAALTSGGEEVHYWVSADGQTVVAYIGESYQEGPSIAAFSEGGENWGVTVIFTAQITDAATGAFAFVLYGPLDHPVSGTEDNLVIPLSFTVTDLSGDSVPGTLTVNVDDDVPVLRQAYRGEGDYPQQEGVVVSDTVTVEDEKIWPGNDEHDGGKQWVWGTIVDDVNWGADGFGQATGFAIDGEHFDAGTTVYWSQDGAFLGTAADIAEGAKFYSPIPEGAAAKLVVFEDGSYVFTLLDNMLLGQGVQGEQVNFLDRVTITGEDGDGDPIGVVVDLKVQDDQPSCFALPDVVIVEDEKMPGGNDEGGWFANYPKEVTGTIVNNVSWGADQFGGAVGFVIDGHTFEPGTTVYWDQSGHFLGTLGNDGDQEVSMLSFGGDHHGGDHGPHVAASLVVNADGTYTFTLLDNMLMGQGVQGEQYDVLDSVKIIGQDGDGDLADVSVILKVQDDVPTCMNSEIAITEDEALKYGIDEPNDASPDYGLVATGNVSDNGSWGADGFGKVTEVQVGSRAYAVDHDGVTLYWAQDGSYLGSHLDHGEVAAAKLEVEQDGSYKFTLMDNLLIRSGQGELLDTLSTVRFTGQDKDGDEATITVTLKVMDDVPTLSVGTVNDANVLLTTQDAQTVDWVEVRPGPDIVHTADTASASFASAFNAAVTANYGADGGSTSIANYTLSIVDSNSGLMSDGVAIMLSKIGNDVVGKAGSVEVFRISVNASTGNVTLTQSEAVDHKEGTSQDDIIALANGKVQLGAMVTVTDNDGDTVSQSVSADLGGNIRFEDDIPSADNISKSLNEDTQITIDLIDKGNVEYGADGAGTVTLASNPSHGSVTLSNGVVTYTPDANYNGKDSFTYTVTDDDGDTVTKTVNLTINPVNDAPVANADTNWVLEDAASAVTGNVLQTLAHNGAPDVVARGDVADTDVDSTLLVTGYTGGNAYGMLTLNANGSYSYTLNNSKAAVQALDDGEKLTETYTYTVTDGTTPKTATLTITIFGQNDAPVANADTNWVLEDAASAITGNVLQTLAHNGAPDAAARGDVADTDVDVETLTVTGYSGGNAYGTLTLNANGGYSYVLNSGLAAVQALDDGEKLTETYTYTVTDGTTPKTATLTITIFGQNDAPVANADTNWVVEDAASAITGNVLESHAHNGAPDAVARGDVADTDVDVETLTVTGFTGGNTYGTLTLNANGSYSYALNNSNPTVQALNDGDKLTETYTYTVSDGTATKTATLTITIFGANDPVLVVGENVNDNSNQTVDHRVDTSPYAPDGSIDGSSSHDVLVGDVGGNNQLAGQKANIAFVLDCSGSMTSQSISFTDSNGAVHNITRLDALKQAVIDALNDLYASGANDVRVHIDTFASSVGSSGTFTLTSGGVDSASQLQAAINFVNGLSVPADSYTNYEAGLVAANSWIDSSGANAPISGADVNKVIFVSDGAPNRAIASGGQVVEVSADDAINHIQGDFSGWLWVPGLGYQNQTDNVSEISLIETDGAGSDQAFSIEAVGISVDSGALSNLSLVEGAGGAATNVDSANELSAVIGTLTGGGTVAQPVGNDVINGGAGNDLIFGDSIHADNVDGGWAKFVQNHNGWSLDALRAELYANHATYGQEGSVGGNDVIDGGAGNDIIYAQMGSDTITGGTGSDTMSGGTGADTFKFVLGDASVAGTVDHITDFSKAQGDILDLKDLLVGEDGQNPGYNMGGFMSFVQNGANTELTISDTNGTTAGGNSQTIVFDNTNLFTQFSAGNSQDLIQKMVAAGNLKLDNG